MRCMFAVALAAPIVVGLVGTGGPALAAFPGTNGTIVFDTAVSHCRRSSSSGQAGPACRSSRMGAS
jgi:uncharacterized membrane protein